MTGLIFALVYLKIGIYFGILTLIATLVLVASLIVISVFDIHHQQIPNIPLLVFYLSGISLFLLSGQKGVFMYLAEGILVSAPLLLLWLVSKGRWLGFGDVLLSIGVGWWLGLSMGFSAILLSFWIGAVFAIIIMLYKRKKMFKVAIPFGPFIALGSLVSFLYTIDMYSIMDFFTWF